MPSAVSSLTDDLLKYYQQVTRAVLGDDPQLMKVSGWGTKTSFQVPRKPFQMPASCPLHTAGLTWLEAAGGGDVVLSG